MDSERPSILLVDDDPLLLRTTQRVLEPCLNVLISPEPAHALSILGNEPVDVLVTDHEIPGTPGGVWLLEQAQERFPDVKRILISGRAVSNAVLANEAVQRFIPKSAGLGQLTAQIAECLARETPA